MTLQLHIPEGARQTLVHAFGEDLSRAALEALAVEGYRSGRLSRIDVQTLLGLSDRWETQAWLGTHGVNLDYSLHDLEQDRGTLNRILGQEEK